MSQATAKRLQELFENSFPDLACLRCGHGHFYILSPAVEMNQSQTGFNDRQSTFFVRGEPDVAQSESTKIDENFYQYLRDPQFYADLICRHCGFTQRHFLPILDRATKPVLVAQNDA